MAKKTRRKTQRKTTRSRKRRSTKRSSLTPRLLWVVLLIGVLVLGYFLGRQHSEIMEHEAPKKTIPAKVFEEIETNYTPPLKNKHEIKSKLTPSAQKPGEITVTEAPRKQKPEAIRQAAFGIEGMIEKLKKRARETQDANRTKAVTKPSPKGRPKLVIIIDDVSQPRQLKAIRALPYKLTPSIFPPSQQNARSHMLAKGLKHFMVHLPMQSPKAKMNRMQGTLMVTDTAETMRKRVVQIRSLFPHAKFVNNHTGSVFTANYRAMKRLYGLLRKEGLVFVDSRTGTRTRVPRIAKEYSDPYIVRDVFLDNSPSQKQIHRQLRQAVAIAKKRGYAITIGHPHKSTLRALKSAKSILAAVDIVYMDELYSSLKK